ncbi:Taurine catabolism dioxygenase TauD, TfdA family [Paraburkholderia steynii]|uniref:Taurine catabolism dioxygenase TauD, TfdA family n=2 Tax=Paraburkholderia steynii TaxID=1245441 RepID=A0A7Z7FPE5_9BURK|nr:Taurine catabolism dioxygenase TauD, TfdA family [Paraburkholderia steynii]
MLGKEVFTATEYPQTLEIPLHSENAYQREWPMVVAFACMQPATAGGATPISSIRVASSLMGASILDMLTELKIKYVRHYRPYVDLPWQTVFQTESKMDVATFCESHDILHEWLDDETLRTEQVCQGTAMHPVLGERVFFNQAHLFHVSSLGTAAAAPLIEMFGENALPRNAFFGDGSELNADFLRRIRSALQKGIIDIEWQRGDVMILDNMQFAHGRRKFTGDRKILVALGEPHRPC